MPQKVVVSLVPQALGSRQWWRARCRQQWQRIWPLRLQLFENLGDFQAIAKACKQMPSL